MNSSSKAATEPIRLVFELTRADHPRLYDDLIQFPKGTKRINRLRVLAYDGLLIQIGCILPGRPFLPANGEPSAVRQGESEITNDLFGPSLPD